MLRVLCKVKISSAFEPFTGTCQSVRWRTRKPRWMPMAKSKLFKIPPRPQIPREEDEELTRLYNHYRTAMKSIKAYLTQRYSEDLRAPADTEQLMKAIDEDFNRCKEINEKWNQELKILREERVANELAADIEFAKKRKFDLEEAAAEKLLEAEEIVRREKIAATTFIRPEDLDEVIEKAINSVVDYNFAIDLEGNKIVGRETKPEEKLNV